MKLENIVTNNISHNHKKITVIQDNNNINMSEKIQNTENLEKNTTTSTATSKMFTALKNFFSVCLMNHYVKRQHNDFPSSYQSENTRCISKNYSEGTKVKL